MSKNIIYICAVIQLQGLRKKPFESGEEVKPENFPAEHFEKLIEGGFIKEKEVVVDTTVVDAEAKAAAEKAAEAEKSAAAEADAAALASAAEEGKGKKK